MIIGSQSLHASYPDLADDLVRSAEVDLIASGDVSRTEWLNVIGQDSPFHEAFGYYADPVDDRTAVLPNGWRERLVEWPPGDTEGTSAAGLDPHDLAIAKYVARRKKDAEFNAQLASRGLLSREKLLALLEVTPIDDQARDRIRGYIAEDFGS